jgi:uncharacterized membrane protein
MNPKLAILISTTFIIMSILAVSAEANKEECYTLTKAYQNDCTATEHSYASTTTVANTQN